MANELYASSFEFVLLEDHSEGTTINIEYG